MKKITGAEYFENGQALSSMDGENSVLIIRHTFEDLAHEHKVFEAWFCAKRKQTFQEQFAEYVDGPPAVHRYNVVHSY